LRQRKDGEGYSSIEPIGFSFLIRRLPFFETLEGEKKSREPGLVHLPPSHWPLISPKDSFCKPFSHPKRILFRIFDAANIALQPFFVNLFFAFLKSF
jgi:hypothetical protein